MSDSSTRKGLHTPRPNTSYTKHKNSGIRQPTHHFRPGYKIYSAKILKYIAFHIISFYF